MRTSTVKTQPVVSSSKNTDIERVNEFLNPVVKEPVRDSWILLECSIAATARLWIIRRNETGKFWPLEISGTVGKEYGGQAKCIHHSYETTPLSKPVLLRSTQTGSIMKDSV